MKNQNKLTFIVYVAIVAVAVLSCFYLTRYFFPITITYDTSHNDMLKLMAPVLVRVENETGKILYSEFQYYPNDLISTINSFNHDTPSISVPPNNSYHIVIEKKNNKWIGKNGGTPNEILNMIGFKDGNYNVKTLTYLVSLNCRVKIEIVDSDTNLIYEEEGFIPPLLDFREDDTLPSDTRKLTIVLQKDGSITTNIQSTPVRLSR
jgi:hypothetical protein